MDDPVEVARTQAKERRAVDLAVAADPVMKRRTETVPVFAGPRLVRLIFAVDKDRLRAPICFFAGKVFAAFEDENLISGRREPLRERGAARAAADYDQIILVDHANLLITSTAVGRVCCIRAQRYARNHLELYAARKL